MTETWASSLNAELYDRWARRFPMYRETSADLVRVAGIESGIRVVDLCCGTGVTTEEVLERVGPDGRVFGVDGSAEMLAVAAKQIDAPNVTFVAWPAETFHLAVDGEIDALVCNSAFWQTNASQVLGSALRVLRPDGTFAFNLGGAFFRFDDEDEQPARRESPMYNRLAEIAIAEYGYTLPKWGRFGGLQPLDLGKTTELLTENGFELVRHEITEVEHTSESNYEWLRVPVFAQRLLPGLPYDIKMKIFERVNQEFPPPAETLRWIHFAAEPMEG